MLLISGSDKDGDHYGASSSDSEDEALAEMQSTGRRPSTNYRPEFAAKTLAQARRPIAVSINHSTFVGFPLTSSPPFHFFLLLLTSNP